MSPEKRTIAILKYINSIESNRIKYMIGSYDNNMLVIYSIYRDVVKKLSPGHHILNNLGYIKVSLLLQENTKYVLPRRYRMLINLISFYYHQKDYSFLFPLVNAITKRSKILFSK
jgi:hypothetical protein